MTIEQLGSIGEFVGSLAVLITLGYLSIQTRQMNKANRQRSHADILTRRNEVLRAQYEHPELLKVLSKGSSGEPMDAMEAQCFTVWMTTLMSHLQDTYVQFKAGLLDRNVWEAEQRIGATLFTQPGFLNWWEHGQQFLTPEFVSVMENSPVTNLVLYDPETNQWSRPEGGLMGKDAAKK